MCTRGLFQLKKVSLYFCDMGGSSKGVRDFLKSDYLKEFLANNPQIQFNFYLKRGSHPGISATYVNGFIKDLSLRNKSHEDVLDDMLRVRNSFGRSALSHSGDKVYGSNKSIQGGWKSNMWNTYPLHELERIRIIPPPPEGMVPTIKTPPNPELRYHKNYIFKVFRETKTDKNN
eukprot:TRINITY_DN3019_c0_g1_i5.p1 TRINITY_DN3019_c0_g1~~TRINITY_DN3019_c0_g1_i5.p1  ORF type:complete len:174 (+),score=4.37 TRINITY_DN3019_c0_g1_i5:113-634(+)